MRTHFYSFLLLCPLSALAACSSDSAPAPGAGCGSAQFCDDFEAYGTGSNPGGDWSAQIVKGAVSVDAGQHHSGTKSVKLQTEAASGFKRALIRLTTGVFPLPNNTMFGRMMFFLESAPQTSMHWTLIQGGGLLEGQDYHALYRYGGQHPIMANGAFVGSQWMANYETPDSYDGKGPSSDCWHHANQQVIPVGKWSCVEWQFDGPNNAMQLWLDGEPLTDLNVRGTGQGCVGQPASFEWKAPIFDSIELGWESYQTDDPRTLWLDDVALDSKRIGCP